MLLPLIVWIALVLAPRALAQDLAWDLCQGAVTSAGPSLSDCRPLEGPIDPQGREVWLRATIPATVDRRPSALHVVGVASSEAWLDGRRLGANGRPGASRTAEIPGRQRAEFPLPAATQAGGMLVVRMSSFHGGLRLARPIMGLMVGDYPGRPPLALLAATFASAGALFASAFGFGVIHALRRTRSSLTLAAMGGAAGSQAVVESLAYLVDYPYPLHAWRVSAIWLLAAVFSVLLVSYVAGRFLRARRDRLVMIAVGVAATTWLVPGFDLKTMLVLLTGVALAGVAAAAGVRNRQPAARPVLVFLALFFVLAVAFPRWLTDLSYFLLAAGLVLPLLMGEVIRLGRDDRGREAVLTEVATRPNRLTVASARGVEFVPLGDILAVVGADDYVEVRLVGGRRLLHAERLDRMEAQLPSEFRRTHRSAIANLTRARRLEREGDRWRLHMDEGMALPVSRSRLPALREALDEGGPPGGA